jgi:hypothetical protein
MNSNAVPLAAQWRNKNKFLPALFLLVIVFFAPLPAVSQEPAPTDILRAADRSRGNVGGIVWEIDIVSREKDDVQQRRLRVAARDTNSLAEFLAPAKVKGQKILMRDRNMWYIKPGLRKPVPLSPRQKLLGQAANGDIASTNYAGDYAVEEMTSDSIDGVACYRLNLRAVNKNVTYDRITYWVSKERHVGVKADFFTVSGKRFKSATFAYDHHITIAGSEYPFVSKMVITDAVLTANVTEMTYAVPTIESVPDATFNLNLLVR